MSASKSVSVRTFDEAHQYARELRAMTDILQAASTSGDFPLMDDTAEAYAAIMFNKASDLCEIIEGCGGTNVVELDGTPGGDR